MHSMLSSAPLPDGERGPEGGGRERERGPEGRGRERERGPEGRGREREGGKREGALKLHKATWTHLFQIPGLVLWGNSFMLQCEAHN